MPRTLLASAIAVALFAMPLRAQDSVRVAVPGEKSPTTARVLGIVPGAGHIYAGETSRGLAHFGTVVGGFLLAGLGAAFDCVGGDCNDPTPALVALAASGYWGWSIYDAGRAAERTNAKRRPMRLSFSAAPVSPMRGGGPDAPALSLSLSVTTR